MEKLQLFYYKSLGDILDKQKDYLKSQKREPVPQDLPEVEELSAGDFVKLGFFKRLLYLFVLRRQRKRLRREKWRQRKTIDDELLKGFNAGVECALGVLKDDYKVFKKHYEKEE